MDEPEDVRRVDRIGVNMMESEAVYAYRLYGDEQPVGGDDLFIRLTPELAALLSWAVKRGRALEDIPVAARHVDRDSLDGACLAFARSQEKTDD